MTLEAHEAERWLGVAVAHAQSNSSSREYTTNVQIAMEHARKLLGLDTQWPLDEFSMTDECVLSWLSDAVSQARANAAENRRLGLSHKQLEWSPRVALEYLRKRMQDRQKQ